MADQQVTEDPLRWLAARQELLAAEKAHLKAADALAAARRNLPKLKVSKIYRFDSVQGEVELAELFAGRSQLIVQHIMFGPDWDAACPICSFWADGYNPMLPHLAQRDVSFAAVSRAPLEKIARYQSRMGWSFPWVSSGNSDFNYDFGVSARAAELQVGRMRYNYQDDVPIRGDEMHGTSVFQANEQGEVLHTYSTYGRGLDPMNAAYAYLDLTPQGRDEAALPFSMAWVKRHDEY